MRHDTARVRAYLAARPRRRNNGHQPLTFALYWEQGLSAGQVAARLGITAHSAAKRVWRIRRAVARWFRAAAASPRAEPVP